MDPTAPSDTPAPSSSTPKRPVYQVATTGSYWTDLKEAVKRVSIFDDFQRIGEIPCARNSLLSGIASGAGIGVIRGMNTGLFAACNWAVGTFVIISIGTWQICQNSRETERRRIQQVVEEMPKRFAKQQQQQQQQQQQPPPQQSDTAGTAKCDSH
ncbi:hypothetical protein JAAARDRAFT_203715 [Jaapia argillacea MUCL 33604]|uniref:Cytochrome c oxidase assembly protein COX20, mitochondrial n=1 Tax=Jaapia argillacea MUCL 33604 TaxID=933084 RepID=A0A067Q6E6_9AGAM|nr:hypothetical protein JAAARDRAFT_203715 [Jaapia argillacea MUCL 33604]